jgi:hypothetical protein
VPDGSLDRHGGWLSLGEADGAMQCWARQKVQRTVRHLGRATVHYLASSTVHGHRRRNKPQLQQQHQQPTVMTWRRPLHQAVTIIVNLATTAAVTTTTTTTTTDIHSPFVISKSLEKSCIINLYDRSMNSPFVTIKTS